MAIEITEFANVTIGVSPVGVQGGNFGILGFLTKDTDPMQPAGEPITYTERSRSYANLTGVTLDWDTSSEVYKAAAAFFAATPTPTDFTVIINFTQSSAVTLVGSGASATITDYTDITDGTFNITADGTLQEVTNLDLSTATDFNDVATMITNELTGLTVQHNGAEFLVLGGNPVGSTLTVASGTIASVTGLNTGVITPATVVETPVQSLAEAANSGADFVGLVTHKDWRDATAITNPATGEGTGDIAAWATGAKKIFCNTTNDPDAVKANVSTDIASEMKGITSRFVLTTYSSHPDQYPSAAVFGRAASVNFSAIDSTLTLNLKQLANVTAENLSKSEYDALKGKYASAVVQIGKTVNAYTDSRMSSGSWLDTTHGLLWLENRCETDQFNLLYQEGNKIPYTQAGINTAAARLDQSLRAAVRNGLSGPGFLPDGTFLPEGYRINVVQLADVASGDKGNRFYNGLSFDMVGAGAMHEVVVSGNFSE